MHTTSSAPDAVVAELHESLVRAADLTEACTVALETVAAACGLHQAAIIARTERGVTGAILGLPPARAAADMVALARANPRLLDAIADAAPPATWPPGAFPPLDFDGFLVLPFPGLQHDGPALGALIVEAACTDGAGHRAAAILGRCGPAMARVAQLDALADRRDQVTRQRDLLMTVLNTLPDPVLLTNAGNDIVLTNRRAEQLFQALPDDSDGRRRAVQINNLLFSSFLTRALIEPDRSASRELNLVDTHDGSDLLFEVLSVPFSSVPDQDAVISVLRDITDLRHALGELEVQFNRSRAAEHEARQERDRLNVILENVSDPILVTDHLTNIILMNPEADRLFVVGPEDEADARARHRIVANDMRFTAVISQFLLRPEQRQVERMAVLDPTAGATFPVEVASSKILNARGEPVAIVSVLHDLTQAEENERLARELQQLNDQLEDRIHHATVELEERNRRLEWQSRELELASRLKSEFLANMSHELRTPINVILGYTSLLRERIYGELSNEQDQALAKTYHTSQHLLALINDILDLSKIEAGKMSLHIEPVLLREVFAELSDSMEPLLEAKGLAWRRTIADGVVVIRTDRTKLKQILLNLLSNAIKFTSNGVVELTAEPLPAGGVRITVRDTGIGIRPEHLDAIFDDFRQLDQSHTREYGGTGLGLSITRKLLTLLRGTISVDSTWGVGTAFSIDLPAHPDEAAG